MVGILVNRDVTVFVYAKLWRRSEVLTDLEFYELRYSGKGAAFLRGFRAFYLGAVFNVLIMASVCLAGIKIGGALLGLSSSRNISNFMCYYCYI
jgi:SSS family solute:Na+ symporter